MEESLVTIILTTLNSERFVARSIESCLNQTYRNLELLVVDGGSQDRTVEILDLYTDPRVRLIDQPENSGKLPGAINLGMANAAGAFITWTQDDCWYEPHAIQTMLDYLRTNPEIALVYSDYWDVDENGIRLSYQRAEAPEFVFTRDVIRVSFLFRREAYEAIGPQETQYFPVHEVPWRAALAKHCSIGALHAPLMSYTVHPDSLTGRFGGWDLERLTADALLAVGGIDKETYRTRMGKIDIDQAYAEYIRAGDYAAFRKHAIRGVIRDFRWLCNLGLLKLVASSFLPFREAYRGHLLQEWQRSIEVEQARLLDDLESGALGAG